MEVTLAELAALTGGTVVAGDPASSFTGVNNLRQAGPTEISFYAGRKFLPDLKISQAGLILVPCGFSDVELASAVLECEHPSLAFAEAVRCFAPAVRGFTAGVHPSAVVDPGAELDPALVSVGPCAVIEAGARIGAGTSIGAGCFVGEGVVIGKDCILHPRSTVYHHCILGDRVRLHSGVVIGADGFGYEFAKGAHQKIDQTGIVQIDADVEIGANTCVDRARFGRTWIGEGSKIDNLVQIAHNVVLGKHVIVVALAGIAGSTRIGDYSIIAAQAGIGGHLELGTQVTVTGQSSVTTSLAGGKVYTGTPVQPMREYQRQQVFVRRLPEMEKRLRALEERISPDPSGG